MKILVVNDDGINAPGIAALARWAGKLGDVTVVAPKYEQSARSHSIDIRNEYEAAESAVASLPGISAHYVASSPADCVRYALKELKCAPDIVFSGINDGLNTGLDINYSATAGAAAEAAINGIRAVAFSTSTHNLDCLTEADLDNVWKFITDTGMLSVCDYVNVNFPPEPKGLKVTRQGKQSMYSDYFVRSENGLVHQTGDRVDITGRDTSVDIEAVLSGFISVTPMTTDRTAVNAYIKLKDR